MAQVPHPSRLWAGSLEGRGRAVLALGWAGPPAVHGERGGGASGAQGGPTPALLDARCGHHPGIWALCSPRWGREKCPRPKGGALSQGFCAMGRPVIPALCLSPSGHQAMPSPGWAQHELCCRGGRRGVWRRSEQQATAAAAAGQELYSVPQCPLPPLPPPAPPRPPSPHFCAGPLGGAAERHLGAQLEAPRVEPWWWPCLWGDSPGTQPGRWEEACAGMVDVQIGSRPHSSIALPAVARQAHASV